jgi:O-antigen/teichoic acid export membrane protein
MSRLLVRRSLTAVGIYSSVVLGFAATVVAAHELHSKQRFGDYATVLFAAALSQVFFDLTVEEAVVKYGFRYAAAERWGRFRRLFTSALGFKLVGSVAGAAALVVFAFLAPPRMTTALLLAAGIPLGQSLEGLGGAVLYLRSRYDLRALLLAWSMGLRLLGVAIGARHGLAAALAGVLAGQVAATATVVVVGLLGFRRFPQAASETLGEDRRGLVSFIVQSSAATGVLSLRASLAPLLLGAVTSTTQVGLFRVAQAPQSAFQSLSAPARMVLLTEQTRDWERGRQAAVLRGVRRYSLVALLLSLVLVPPLYVFMPSLIRLVYTSQYVGAANAARVFVLAAAVQLVVGWTKSFPVTIGRPGLRVVTHGVEAVVVLPLVLLFGWFWGATGAALAVLGGMVVFAALWAAIFVRIRPEDVQRPPDLDSETASEESDAAALAR